MNWPADIKEVIQTAEQMGTANRTAAERHADECLRRVVTKLADLVGEDEVEAECPDCGHRFFQRFKGIRL